MLHSVVVSTEFYKTSLNCPKIQITVLFMKYLKGIKERKKKYELKK
jgi:hypothetical protein